MWPITEHSQNLFEHRTRITKLIYRWLLLLSMHRLCIYHLIPTVIIPPGFDLSWSPLRRAFDANHCPTRAFDPPQEIGQRLHVKRFCNLFCSSAWLLINHHALFKVWKSKDLQKAVIVTSFLELISKDVILQYLLTMNIEFAQKYTLNTAQIHGKNV